VFAYVAAILWLGNVDFAASDTTEHGTSIAPGPALQYSALLLGVSQRALSTALTSRSITTGSERIVSPLNQQQVSESL
jgi:myosin-5